MRKIGLAGALWLLFSTVLAASDAPADRMLARLRGLAGRWEGTLAWSHGRTGSGTLQTEYYVTGNGSAVVENLIMDGKPTMSTVYHLDGADLRMTHYCGAQNQPRLKAARLDEATGTIEFSFVDVTNAGAHPAYVTAFTMQMVDADHLKLQFTFGGAQGTTGIEDIQLSRMASPSPPS